MKMSALAISLLLASATAVELQLEFQDKNASHAHLPKVPAVLNAGADGFPSLPEASSLLGDFNNVAQGISTIGSNLEAQLKMAEQEGKTRIQNEKILYEKKLHEQEEKNRKLQEDNSELAKKIMSLHTGNEGQLKKLQKLEKVNSFRRTELRMLEKEFDRAHKVAETSLSATDDSEADELKFLRPKPAKKVEEAPPAEPTKVEMKAAVNETKAVTATSSADVSAKTATSSADVSAKTATSSADVSAKTATSSADVSAKTATSSADVSAKTATSSADVSAKTANSSADESAKNSTNGTVVLEIKPLALAAEAAAINTAMDTAFSSAGADDTASEATSDESTDEDDSKDDSKDESKDESQDEEASSDDSNASASESSNATNTTEDSSNQAPSFIEISLHTQGEGDLPDLEEVGAEVDKELSSSMPEDLVGSLEKSLHKMREQAQTSEDKLKKLFQDSYKAGIKRHDALVEQNKALTQSLDSMSSYQKKLQAAEERLNNTQTSLVQHLSNLGNFLGKLQKAATTKVEDVKMALEAAQSWSE